jgi:hypothetical protein
LLFGSLSDTHLKESDQQAVISLMGASE